MDEKKLSRLSEDELAQMREMESGLADISDKLDYNAMMVIDGRFKALENNLRKLLEIHDLSNKKVDTIKVGFDARLRSLEAARELKKRGNV